MTGHPFTDVDPDDADHLLFMVAEAHKPFSSKPVTLGDIADEWSRRWRKAHPRATPAIGHSLNPRVMMLAQAYARPQVPEEAAPTFDFEAACAALAARWPGITIGAPERNWAAQPVIAEIARLRAEAQSLDTNRFRNPVREMVR